MEEFVYTQSELFEIITSKKGWYEGFCTQNNARQIRLNHRRGKLHKDIYEEIFFHFGYVKHTTWTKPNTHDFS